MLLITYSKTSHCCSIVLVEKIRQLHDLVIWYTEFLDHVIYITIKKKKPHQFQISRLYNLIDEINITFSYAKQYL